MRGEEGEWLAALGNKMDRMWCDLTAIRNVHALSLSVSHMCTGYILYALTSSPDGVYEIPTSQSEGLSQYHPMYQSGTVC